MHELDLSYVEWGQMTGFRKHRNESLVFIEDW
jgi:hypothetical protein